MIRLFTTSYPESDPARAAEFEECLRRNIACAEIGEICVLAEGRSRSSESSKVVSRPIAQRPKYSDYLAWIREVAEGNDVSIIANSDIYFDSRLSLLEAWTMPADTVLALSRWDATGPGQARLYDHNDSQDSWIFRGKPRDISGDFPTGVPRCDNRFAHELEAAGYNVVNPSFSLRSYHLHASPRKRYAVENQASFVAPPYKYIWPHNLWSLPGTLAHNILNPRARVGWRVDRRRWKRNLRFHWLEKAWRVLTASGEPQSRA